jgi:type VI secretion system Hcp family effector
MAIFLQYGDVKGDCEEENHKQWCLCDSIHLSAHRAAHTHLGKGTERQGTEVSIGDISISKPMDAASPYLFQASLGGFGKTAKINITRTGETGEIKHLEITLEKACVTRYEINTEGQNHSELLTLNFLKIGMAHTPVNQDGSPGTRNPIGFDIAKGISAPTE